MDEAIAAGAAEELRRWLSSGRLQDAAGAFCAWRHRDQGELAFAYPEITGYALTWLAGRPELTSHELAAGNAAATWLLRRLADDDRSAREGWDGGAIYTFDLGMIAAGLISFGRRVQDERYEELGGSVAAELAAWVDSPAGLRALAPVGPSTSRPPEWSTEGRPHLLKCAQSLLLAEHHAAVRTLLTASLEYEADDGHFVTQPGDEYVMLHPHLYTVEGLWMVGVATSDDDALARARRAVEWAWGHQLPSGGFPRWASETEAGPEQFDVTSQALRAAVLLDADVEGLDRAARRLTEIAKQDGTHGGALVYRDEGPPASHLNAWVTMFGAQALEAVAAGPSAIRWTTLV